MLYDLNIPWTPATRPADLEATLQTSAALGYSVVALNHVVTLPIQGPSITNPIPLPPYSTAAAAPKLPRLLRRATLVLADPAAAHRLPELARAYDLLAVRPTTEKAFAAACTTLPDTALVSLDLAARFPFHFRPAPVRAAVRRGVRFELCYAQALAAGVGVERDRLRAAFVGNLRGLLRAARGRGLIISSEADGPARLRAPADVANLLAVWGLDAGRAAEALGPVPRALVLNEGLKRRGGRGVVDVLHGAGPVERGGGDGAATAEKAAGEGVEGRGKLGKRKAVATETPPVSKKQSKRIRRAQLKEQLEDAAAQGSAAAGEGSS